MRRRRKVFYYVQDWGSGREFWWNRGEWREPVENDERRIKFRVNGVVMNVGNHGASSTKSCRNLRVAMRCARRLQAAGGVPLISRSVIYSRGGEKKRKWIEWMLGNTGDNPVGED